MLDVFRGWSSTFSDASAECISTKHSSKLLKIKIKGKKKTKHPKNYLHISSKIGHAGCWKLKVEEGWERSCWELWRCESADSQSRQYHTWGGAKADNTTLERRREAEQRCVGDHQRSLHQKRSPVRIFSNYRDKSGQKEPKGKVKEMRKRVLPWNSQTTLQYRLVLWHLWFQP